jgi:hypothetical protein
MQHDERKKKVGVSLTRERRELTDMKRELEAYLRIVNFALHSPIESEIGTALMMVRGDLRRLVGGDDI